MGFHFARRDVPCLLAVVRFLLGLVALYCCWLGLQMMSVDWVVVPWLGIRFRGGSGFLPVAFVIVGLGLGIKCLFAAVFSFVPKAPIDQESDEIDEVEDASDDDGHCPACGAEVGPDDIKCPSCELRLRD